MSPRPRTSLSVPPMDKRIFWLTVGFSLIGLIAISSASTVLSYQRFGYNTFYLMRQAISVLIGLVMMFVISRIDYHWFKRYSPLLFLGVILLLLVVLIPGIGLKVGNARRWIDFGFTVLQPSEFAKLGVILYLAAWFDSRPESVIRSFPDIVFGPLVAVGAAAGLVILQPDFGSAISFAAIATIMLFAGGIKMSHFGALLAAGGGLVWLAIQAVPYRLARIFTFLNPGADPLGAGYQINQALLAVGSGGLWGLGFGESRQKFNFLPEPINDSIFAIMSEELGFARVMIFLLMYAIFALFGLRLAKQAPDVFSRLVVIGVVMWVVTQATINIGATIGIMPLTGIPLPFVSYGGSSVIALLCGMGIVLNISRYRT